MNEPPDSIDAKIDPGYADQALALVRTVVKGNGVKTDDVEIKNFEGAICEFTATTRLKLKTSLSERTVAGKTTGPQQANNAQAMREAIAQEQKKTLQDPTIVSQINEAVLAREDKGLGLDNELIQLPFLHKEFVYYEACGGCKSQGKMPCKRCHGKGYEQCPRCHASGYEVCTHCNGARQIASQGGHQQCPRCHGHGKTSCSLCQQTKKIQCKVCKTQGSTTCTNCNGHGWNSHITKAEINANGNFEYDQKAVSEEINKIIQRLGPKLINHVQMNPEKPEKGQEDPEEILFPYKMRIPHGDITFRIKDQDIPGLLFGTQGKIFNMPSFLEDLIRPGIEKLTAAGTGQGSVSTHIKEAARYRTVKQAIMASAKFKKEKAMRAVLHHTPLGISKNTAQKMVKDADQALKALTKKPRQIGIALGALSALALCGGYFLTPIRTGLLENIPGTSAHMGLDILVVAVGAGIGFVLAQMIEKNSRKKTLQAILSGKS